MSDLQYCKLPTAISSLCAMGCNIAMVWYIWYKKSLKGPMKTLVTNLACIDALFSATICIRSFQSLHPSQHKHIPATIEAVVMSYGCFLTLSQLGSQLSISLERLCVVRHPIKYRTVHSMSSRLGHVIAIWVGSIVLGAGIGVSCTIFQLPKMLSFATWICFSATLAIQAITYGFIIKEIRVGQRVVDEVTVGNSGLSYSMRSIEERSRQQERQLHILAVGITVSFIVGTLPFMVYVGIYDVKMESQGCSSLENIFYTASLCFICLNMLFDPLWYFAFSYRLTKQRNRAPAMTTNASK